ncbi:Gp19/Gp15/Gp42 family protein [Amycolatopsis kentuckyensis]|uniref:Gp19/Gp15/Gp42 family protein n=1 Tax=Amycolatopsis kentuckyensis TaxID=218823 RepID=UPI003566893E
MAYATLEDVVKSLGRPIAAGSLQGDQVEQWLSDVELIIRARLGDLAALIAADQLDVEALVYVERESVIRKVRNPEGKVSEDIDDYRYRLNADAAKGSIFVTDDEWALLAPQASPAAGAYSVPLGVPWGAP